MKRFFLVFILQLNVLLYAQVRIDSVSAMFLHAFGQEGDGAGEFRQPMAIAVDASGNVYVADTGNHRVQKFTEKGMFLSMVGGFGWNKEQFQRPVDVCADNALDVYVADYDNRRIERFDKDLHWISTFRSNPDEKEKLMLGFPAGVALSRHGDLFVSDRENRRILKLNIIREAEVSFGDYDSGAGAIVSPAQIAISADDRIFVADQAGGHIIVFDYFGNFLQTIGQGILKEPIGLDIDINGQLIFVSDLKYHQIFIFDVFGRYLGVIGTPGVKFGAFNNPTDVAFYKNLLYITESNNHRVQIFRLQYHKRS